MPDLTVWYGPDSYMGGNLVEMFQQMLALSDEEIAAIHPSHTRGTIAALLPRLKYFKVFLLMLFKGLPLRVGWCNRCVDWTSEF